MCSKGCDTLAKITRRAGLAVTEHTDTPARLMTGCEIVKAGEASRAHHAWSPDPWTSKGAVPLPGRPFQFHPTAVGMRAVAELVARRVSKLMPSCGP